jgi:hypothetical protein
MEQVQIHLSGFQNFNFFFCFSEEVWFNSHPLLVEDLIFSPSVRQSRTSPSRGNWLLCNFCFEKQGYAPEVLSLNQGGMPHLPTEGRIGISPDFLLYRLEIKLSLWFIYSQSLFSLLSALTIVISAFRLWLTLKNNW